jgi:hypothetical protein
MVARTKPHPKSGKRLKMAADLIEEAEMKTLIHEVWKSDPSSSKELLSKVLYICLGKAFC